MGLTTKMTRRFKEDNCTGCNLANKVALKAGKYHCSCPGLVSVKNGQCEQRK